MTGPNEDDARLLHAEKIRALQHEIEKGMQDIKAGRVREWDLTDFLRRAHTAGSGR